MQNSTKTDQTFAGDEAALVKGLATACGARPADGLA